MSFSSVHNQWNMRQSQTCCVHIYIYICVCGKEMYWSMYNTNIRKEETFCVFIRALSSRDIIFSVRVSSFFSYFCIYYTHMLKLSDGIKHTECKVLKQPLSHLMGKLKEICEQSNVGILEYCLKVQLW